MVPFNNVSDNYVGWKVFVHTDIGKFTGFKNVSDNYIIYIILSDNSFNVVYIIISANFSILLLYTT